MSLTNRLPVTFLALAVAVCPVLINAAEVSDKRELASITLKDSSRLVPGQGRSVTLQVVEQSGERVLHGTVIDGPRSATIDGDRHGFTLSDGSGIYRETLADTPAEYVMKIDAVSPTGKRAAAVVRYNKVTRQGESTGIEKVRGLLEGSADYSLIAAVLPSLAAATSSSLSRPSSSTSATSAPSTSADKHFRIGTHDDYGDPTTDGWLGCALGFLGIAVALVIMIGACGAPVVDLFACGPAIAGVVAAALYTACACSDYEEC
jgi:hypothetical protein